MKKERAVIICGPTASGKTNFAHHLAKKRNGEIVNADSMQIYKQIPIITASPDDNLKNEIPYHLYNFCDVDQEFSAAKYVQMASKVINQIASNNKLPVIVGGTGMYINMLVNGYSAIPEIDNDIRQKSRNLHKEVGSEEFFRLLSNIDSEIVKKLDSGDSQRVIRAYEVAVQTGKSILYYQSQDNIKLLDNFEFEILFLLPERKFLYDMCNKRFIELFDNGSVAEVKKMYSEYGNVKTTATKALGVNEIISYLNDEITREVAIELASAKTRQYAKRQITWFSNQIKNKTTLEFNNLKEYKNVVENYS